MRTKGLGPALDRRPATVNTAAVTICTGQRMTVRGRDQWREEGREEEEDEKWRRETGWERDEEWIERGRNDG